MSYSMEQDSIQEIILIKVKVEQFKRSKYCFIDKN